MFPLSSEVPPHTPSIAFRHLPPNSAGFSYATEGALFVSAQLSTDAVSAFGKVWGPNKSVKVITIASKHARKHEECPSGVKKKKSVSI